MSALMGDILLLRDGSEVTYIQPDPRSGWPIVQKSDGLIIPLDPVLIEGEFDDGSR